MKNLKLKLKENYIYLLSFIIPIILMGIIYAVIGIYPFGNKNIITSDMYLQYVAFLSRVKDILSGDAFCKGKLCSGSKPQPQCG